jgi:PAS domain S-box-containing protein
MGIRQRLLGVFGLIAVVGVICVVGLFHWQTKAHARQFAALQLHVQRAIMESRIQEFLHPARQTAAALMETDGDGDASWREAALWSMEAFPSVAAIRVIEADKGETAFFRGAGLYHLGRFKADAQQWTHFNPQGKESLPPSNWMADSWIPKDYQPKKQPWSAALQADQDGLRWSAPPNSLTPGATAALPVGVLLSGGDVKILTVIHLFVDAFPNASTEVSPETEGTALVFSGGELWFPDGAPTQEDVALLQNMLPETIGANERGAPQPVNTSWRKWWLDGSSETQTDLPFGLAAMHSHDSLRRNLVGSPALLLLLAVAALLLAIALPWWIINAYGRPIDALTDRLYNVEHLSAAKEDWPESDLPELQALTQAAKEMCRYWEQRILGLSKVQTLEPVADEAQSKRVGKLARDFMDTLQQERPDAPPPESEPVPMPTESSAEKFAREMTPIAGESLSEPPTAFVQAMQSTRKQLSRSELQLSTLYEEYEAASERSRLYEQRLFAQRKMLGMLAREFVAENAGLEEVAARLLEAAARTLNLASSSLWRLTPDGKGLACVARYDKATQAHSAGGLLERSGHPIFFIAAESQDIIRVRDAANDPRAPKFPSADDEAALADAMLITPVCCGGRWQAILCHEHTGDARNWTVDEESFALSLSQFAAHLLTRLDGGTSVVESESEPRGGRVAAIDWHEEAPMYRWLLDSAGTIVWALNATGEITYANVAAEEAYGLDAMEMVGKQIAEFASPASTRLDDDALRRILNGQEVYTYETEHMSAAGKPMLLRVTLSYLQDETGGELGAVAVARDITETSRKERRLQEREAHYRELVEDAPQVIWSVDAIGSITALNAAAETVYGYHPEELVGQSISMLALEGYGPRDLDQLYKLLGGEPCTHYRTRHEHKNGKPLDMLIVGAPRYDEQGRIIGALGCAIPSVLERDATKGGEEAMGKSPETEGENDAD